METTKIFDGFTKAPQELQIDALLVDHLAKYNVQPIDAMKHFPVLARRQLLKRFLAHVDLFKLTLEIPGDIAELGVFRGFDLFTWANLLEAYSIGDRTKIVFGFDNWEGFVELDAKDGDSNVEAHKFVGGFSPKNHYEELCSAIQIFDKDRFIPSKPRIKLIKGNIESTVPDFIEMNPGVRFSLIHFDCDLYKPTLTALNSLWPRLSRGGIIMFDEYSIHDWPGETKAVDEFLVDKPEIILKKLNWNNVPAAYLIKTI